MSWLTVHQLLLVTNCSNCLWHAGRRNEDVYHSGCDSSSASGCVLPLQCSRYSGKRKSMELSTDLWPFWKVQSSQLYCAFLPRTTVPIFLISLRKAGLSDQEKVVWIDAILVLVKLCALYSKDSKRQNSILNVAWPVTCTNLSVQ